HGAVGAAVHELSGKADRQLAAAAAGDRRRADGLQDLRLGRRRRPALERDLAGRPGERRGGSRPCWEPGGPRCRQVCSPRVETWPGVQVNGGLFSVLLGSGGAPMPAGLFPVGSNRWLSVEINGELLTPRQQLGSVAYSSLAQKSADLECDGCIQETDIAPASI